MPPVVTYHTNYARRDWALFALFVLAAALACAALGFALARDEIEASRRRAELVARTIAERFAEAGVTPGSNVATVLAPLSEAGAPDLTLAIIEERSSGAFAYMLDGRYLGHSEPEKAGKSLDPRVAADRHMIDLVRLAHERQAGQASFIWKRGEVSAASVAHGGGVVAVVDGLRPRALSQRPRTIALILFGMLVLFAAGLHDVLPRIGRYINLLVLAGSVAVVALLGKALEPGLWRPVSDDLLIQKAEALKLADLVRALSVDLPAPPSAVITWGVKVAAGACLFYAVALTGVFHRLGRFVRREALAYRLAAPAFGLVVLLAILPGAISLVLSFFRATPTERTFVGLANFAAFALVGPQNPTSIWRVLLLNVGWTAASALLQMSAAVFLALLVAAAPRRLRLVYQTLLIIPWALPSQVSALLWAHLFREPLLATWLPADWLSTPVGSFTTSLAVNVWTGTSLLAVLGVASLDQLPHDAVEALRYEGVRGWRLLQHLYLPFLRPLLLPGFALAMLLSLSAFSAVDLVSGGAPEGATDLLVTRAYRWAFERFEFGYAAAWSLVALALAGGAVVLFWRALRQVPEEEGALTISEAA